MQCHGTDGSKSIMWLLLFVLSVYNGGFTFESGKTDSSCNQLKVVKRQFSQQSLHSAHRCLSFLPGV